ncbi:MAG TPA: 3D domain-containing protein [Kofleriaceae bacterium]|nr:3D domain-containing protein [Kofleriaceae bacterium]
MSLPPFVRSTLLATTLAAATGGCAIEGEASAATESQPSRYPVEALAIAEPAPAPVVEVPPESELGQKLGTFEMTYYWMATERSHSKAKRPILDKRCEPLAEVSERFAGRLAIEGSGRLRDGRVVNTAGRCDCDERCFFVVPRGARFGVGANAKPLSPFRTVAVDRRTIPINTTLYVPELDGRPMPGSPPWGGFVHDGCVIAGDVGGNVRGNQIDFFTARRSQYRALTARDRLNEVTVYDGKGRCEQRGRQVVAINRNSI